MCSQRDSHTTKSFSLHLSSWLSIYWNETTNDLEMTLVVHTRLHKRRQHNVFYNSQKTVPTFAEMQQTYHPCYDLHNCQKVTLLKVAQIDYDRKKRRI